jgi:phage anti-repressor protein
MTIGELKTLLSEHGNDEDIVIAVTTEHETDLDVWGHEVELQIEGIKSVAIASRTGKGKNRKEIKSKVIKIKVGP